LLGSCAVLHSRFSASCVCTLSDEREAFVRDLETGLRIQSQHAAIRSAIELLKSQHALQQLHADVTAAREELQALTDGGHPVVYAIRVDPEWFETPGQITCEAGWREGVRLICSDRADVLPERLLGKVAYPNGTDRTFMPNLMHEVVGCGEPHCA
jgi:hypothetical protein